MHKRIVVRKVATNEPVFISDWTSPEEFDEAWDKCLKKPFFFGDCRAYKKEIEYKREFSVHFTDIFNYSNERVFDTAAAAMGHANKRFMFERLLKGVYVMDDSSGEIIFNMERDPFYINDFFCEEKD